MTVTRHKKAFLIKRWAPISCINMSPAGLKKNPRQPRIPTAPRNARAIQQLMWTSARN